MDIKEYHGYKVFDDGTIIGRNGRKLSQVLSGNLYRVSMYYDSAYHTAYVHKIVAELFVENPRPDEYTMVSHKDGDMTNNNASNLIWTAHCVTSKSNSKVEVVRTSPNGEEVHYESLTDAGLKNNCSASNVHNYITGRQIDKRGYTWKRA